MKKLFTLFIFLCAALSSSADEHIVYLCPGWTDNDWAKDDARFALYMYKDGGGSEWVDFVPMSYTENVYDNGVLIKSRKVYGAVFSSGENDYDHFILCRMKPNTENNWDNKWNQSENISAPTEDVFYDLTGWGAWDHGSINDYAKKSFSFVVAGDKQVVTNNEGWNSSSTNNVMNKTEEAFTYSFHVSSQFAAPGNEFKVVFQPMGWWHGDPNNSGENFPVSIDEMGCYSIDYTFDFQTGVATATPTLDTSKVVRFYLAEVTGTDENGGSQYDNWWNNMMETSGAKATFYAPNKSLTAGTTLKYKVVRSVQSANSSSDPWADTWHSGSVDSDYNFGYSPESTGSFNVTFSWDAKAETSSVEAAELPSSYYVVGGVIGGNWTVGNQITGVNNVFTVDFAEQQGKGFVLVPNYDVSAGNVTNWTHAIRPLSNTDIIFANNTGTATIADKAQNWRFETYNGRAKFTYNGLTNHWTVEPYFERTLPAAAEGYATFSSNENVAIPEGITAMYPTEVSDKGVITWKKFKNGIPARQGALLKGTLEGNADTPYTFVPTLSTDVVPDNATITMEPIPEKTQLAQKDGDYTRYILSKVNNTLGLYKVNSNDSWVNAGTAYLKVLDGTITTAPAFFPLTGETTAIDNLTTEPAAKGEEKIYSLDGRRIVGQPTAKGIYIVNGKKLLKK